MAQGKVEYCHRGFFARYAWDMLAQVARSRIGCNVGGTCINILSYADDIVLLAPSWRGLQHLLDIVMQQCESINNMSLNDRKSVCMVFFLRVFGLKWYVLLS